MNLRCWLGLHEWGEIEDRGDMIVLHYETCRRCGCERIVDFEDSNKPRQLPTVTRKVGPPNPRPKPKPRPRGRPDVRVILRDVGGQDMFVFDEEPVTAEACQRLHELMDAMRGGQATLLTPTPTRIPPPIPPAKTIRVELLNMGVPIPCPGSVIWSRRAVAQTGSPQTLADGSAIFRDLPVTRIEREFMDAMEVNRQNLCGTYPGSAAAIAAGRMRRRLHHG
jgi:hypothetical protein